MDSKLLANFIPVSFVLVHTFCWISVTPNWRTDTRPIGDFYIEKLHAQWIPDPWRPNLVCRSAHFCVRALNTVKFRGLFQGLHGSKRSDVSWLEKKKAERLQLQSLEDLPNSSQSNLEASSRHRLVYHVETYERFDVGHSNWWPSDGDYPAYNKNVEYRLPQRHSDCGRFLRRSRALISNGGAHVPWAAAIVW